MFWCSGLRLVARLLDRRAGERGRDGVTTVRHQDTGWSLSFASEPAARRFLERYCCEPAAFDVVGAGEDDARAAA
jgi:hypothetical protein